jgi:hypothetical protein
MFSSVRRRLRHPIRSITEPFGKAGLTVAIFALVFAMVGGAWAAGGLNPKQKKEVTKIAKKFAGKNGTNGAPGERGPQGEPGKAGENGKPGTSVTGAPIPTSSATCNHLGGIAYTSASSTENVCNGQTGFTKTLPEGETERGDWSMIGSGAAELIGTSASFNIPLAEAPLPHLIRADGMEVVQEGCCSTKEVTSSVCTGKPEAPTAAPGNLCVYVLDEQGLVKTIGGKTAYPAILALGKQKPSEVVANIGPSEWEADPFGFGLDTFAETAVNAGGTWAVTAE